MKEIILLDGPMGTELAARGVPTPLPGWSSHALDTAPGIVEEIHRTYARVGAHVHTTNSFRTRPTILGERWEELARLAVRLARSAVSPAGRVAGSIAPLEDCYRPDLSPARDDPLRTRREHAELARVLADEGCDLLLCETFPCVEEGLIAVEAALATGLETWASFTPGPKVDLASAGDIARAGMEAARRGASAILVNCLPSDRVGEFLDALASKALPSGVRLGAYANAGRPNEVDGWTSMRSGAEAYAELAAEWRQHGATIIGGCCGTGPEHVSALVRRLGRVDRELGSGLD